MLDLFDEIQQGFSDQAERSDDLVDYWDVYNCKLTGHQFYDGNSKIFVPIVHNAVDARKTRFTNQIFPTNGRNVEVTSSDGEMPYATMSLLEYYIARAQLRTKVMPALVRNGDVEGQYNLYVSWEKRKRNVTYKVTEEPETAPGEGPNVAAEPVESIKHQEVEDGLPCVEVIRDCDVLVLPQTADSIPEAIAAGGSVTIIRRWGKAKVRAMMREGVLREDAGEALIGQMTSESKPGSDQKNKVQLEAAGIKNDGGTKFALVYQTYSDIKVRGERVICEAFYGGEQQILGCRRNPLWSDRVPVLSVPVEKVAGAFKGIAKVKPCCDIQYFANDAINEAADSAAYALMPIVMTDPAKNPRVGSMVLSLAAVWETSPQDTSFAEFPALWKDGFQMVAAAKAEIGQTLSVSPAAITTGGAQSQSKMSQAEIAQEQQIDILNTADAVTVIEEGILTPLLELFVEMDHQYRDEDITVKQFGQMGVEAQMEDIPPIQYNARYQYKWFGVEQARSAQQVQQQIAGMNVIRGIPPEQLNGYKVNLVPIVTQLVENTFGPRLAPLIFLSPEQQMPVPVDSENNLLLSGYEVPVHDLDDDQQHIQAHTTILQTPEGKAAPNAKKTLAHIFAHMQQMAKKQQAAMQPPGGAPGVPGGAVGPAAAARCCRFASRMGAQPAQATGGQGPPGMIHHDQLPRSHVRGAHDGYVTSAEYSDAPFTGDGPWRLWKLACVLARVVQSCDATVVRTPLAQPEIRCRRGMEISAQNASGSSTVNQGTPAARSDWLAGHPDGETDTSQERLRGREQGRLLRRSMGMPSAKIQVSEGTYAGFTVSTKASSDGGTTTVLLQCALVDGTQFGSSFTLSANASVEISCGHQSGDDTPCSRPAPVRRRGRLALLFRLPRFRVSTAARSRRRSDKAGTSLRSNRRQRQPSRPIPEWLCNSIHSPGIIALGPATPANSIPTVTSSQYPTNTVTTSPTPLVAKGAGSTGAVTGTLTPGATATAYVCGFVVSACWRRCAGWSVGPVRFARRFLHFPDPIEHSYGWKQLLPDFYSLYPGLGGQYPDRHDDCR